MTEKVQSSLEALIWFSFLTLVVVTPLIFSTRNSELFEVPKMHFVYLAATVILFSTLAKFIPLGKILIPRNWPLATFLAFLILQTLSTFFSIDKFTSIFGYPSRLNGGLLSQLAYFAIFACALVNLSFEKAQKLLIAAVLSALAVSLWGIPGHFGRDPSCFVLTDNFNSSCWQKEFDPQVRIFSTLGQPNWLASYLVLMLPFALIFLIAFKKLPSKLIFAFCSMMIFFALILTNSRAGAFGALTAILIFLALLGLKNLKANLKFLAPVIIGFVLIALAFGTTLTSRIGEAIFQNQKSESVINQPSSPTSQPFQKPTSAGTESGQIRLIVWQGAFTTFKKWPILGSGPETFAYSYYLFRPIAHNQTTEWNFFYNKAHNELLNYLGNTGFLGLVAYLTFLTVSLVALYKISKDQNSQKALLAKAAIASVLGYQTTIFFGFSVVTTQLLMFLIIASTMSFNEKGEFKLPFLKNPYAHNTALALTIVLGFLSLSYVMRIILADLTITNAKILQTPSSLTSYSRANQIFPTANPFYLADYSYEAALFATSGENQTISQTFARQTDQLAQKALRLSLNNLIIARKIANAYFLIATLDEKYKTRALDVGQNLTKLAPTDPQTYLALAKIQAGLDQKEKAVQSLKKALDLKPDYQEAKELLEQIESKTIDN